MKLILSLLIILYSCGTKCPPATPENIRKWERRHKFRAQVINDSAYKDSVKMAWKLSSSRKY